MPNLQNRSAGIEKCSRGCFDRNSMRLQRSGVEDRINPRQTHREDYRPSFLAQNFFWARHPSLREANDALGIDAVDGPLHYDPVRVVQRRDLLPFVDQKGKGEVILGPKFRMAFGALRVDSEDL